MEMMSPKYEMKLVADIENTLWNSFESSKYKNVKFYIEKWHEESNPFNYNDYVENFTIHLDENQNIDLPGTLHSMDGELLIKIAVDLGIETPDIIPGMAFFRNEIKAENETASQVFEKAFKNIESDPADAVGFANSALESIIKEILADDRIKVDTNKNDTLYKLTTALLKAFKIYPDSGVPAEINRIGSSLLSICQGIESLRSEQTDMHGKTKEDAKIEDTMYAYFVVNAVTTVGLFLKSFYKSNFPPPKGDAEDDGTTDDDLPF